MNTLRIVACLLVTSVCLPATPATLTIDAGRPAAKVSPRLYGLMTEEINFSYDGGLYAELVRNRAFLDKADEPVHWSVVQDGGAAATIALDRAQPLNDQIPVSLRVEVTKPGSAGAGVANDGYWGIPVQPKTTYRASFFAKATGFSGSVTLSLESADGHTVYASRKVKGIGAEWRQLEATLTTGDLVATDKARYVLRLDQPGTVWFGFVSLFPPTWNNRTNGFRKDLMQLLVDTKPKFLRFPGGNYLEGNKIAERFEWKKTIGPIARRPGHQSPWGYRSTDGMGLLEFLQWCEDMGAEPVLAVYAGYSLEGERVKAGPDLEPYVQDALEEIEYVTGGANTRWGAQRVKDGHPAPFALHYVEIGNEDGFDKENTYDGRFTQFFDAIKARYPALKCIATITPNDKKEKQVHSRAPQVFDEHYYDPVDGFLAKGRSHYDNYDRKGPEIFVGEWAAYETAFPPWNEKSKQEAPTPNLRAAIGDAAFMTNMERNSDVVVMHCYAPLFVNVNPGGRQWRPDMIGYDALRSYGSPSYYAFRLFSTHVGDEILKVTPAAENSLFASVTRASATGEIYLKLVNARPEPATVAIELPGVTHLGAEATAWVLAAPSDAATNSMTSPTAVVPQRQTVTGVHSGFTYSVPANGIVVLVLQSKK